MKVLKYALDDEGNDHFLLARDDREEPGRFQAGYGLGRSRETGRFIFGVQVDGEFTGMPVRENCSGIKKFLDKAIDSGKIHSCYSYIPAGFSEPKKFDDNAWIMEGDFGAKGCRDIEVPDEIRGQMRQIRNMILEECP